MARPQRVGLDYFPFSVDLLKDPKLREPRDKYGYIVNDVYIATLCWLYKERGYYIPYGTQKDKNNCIWFIQDCMQGKYPPSKETIAEIIEELVACELFSGDHYPQNITSKRCQQEYYSATIERKSVVIDKKLWLLSLEEMKKLSAKHSYYLEIVGQPRNKVNQPNNEESRSNNPQIKSNKTKSNQTKGIYSDSQTAEADEAELEFYLNNISTRVKELKEDFDEYKERILDIVSQSVKYGKLTIGKVEVGVIEFLKALITLFISPEQFMTVFDAVDSSNSVKNKFLYTVAALYNTAKKF